ncbi:hypothetical protein [Methylobacterium sp. WL8]|uniref:hypothetical protein n=1 Tax=Methylobacterium sp. WL8 TaxID=2603899 RepID=UPI0011C937BC|nr:hypothetical protein [Methylobacterium sp. WL8]TXN83003.1 hypothetical protein FV234_08230 [Methylobacterium sp. WL8]
MSEYPRPATSKDVFFGAIWVILAIYIDGIAIWTWLFWQDQTLDPSRLLALMMTVPMFVVGLGTISKWLKGEWFEEIPMTGRKEGSPPSDNTNHHGGGDPPQS